MAIRLNTPTRWSLWLVGASALALALATGSGACVNPPQSLPGEGGGGQSGTGGGASVDPNKGKQLFQALESDLYAACGSCHDAGGVADTPFLAGPDRYQSMVSWPGIVVKNAAESKMLTYPVAGPQHTYAKLDADTYKDTLYPAVKAWLEEEAKAIVLTDPPTQGPAIDPFTPIMGFNAIYLGPLGADFEGMAITFTANELTDSTLELDDIEVHPTAKLGVHMVHPLFAVYPKGKPADPDPVDSFSNVEQYFEAGQAGLLGPGTLILTNWAPEAKLSVAFETIEKIDPIAGDGGVPTGSCKDVASFSANAAGPLQQNCFNCHGGGNQSAKGAVDMSALQSDPAAACAQILNRVNPADPPTSQLFITTDPGGNAAHPYKFGGSATNFNNFKTSVSNWIAAEK